MSRPSASQSSKQYRRRAARLARSISYYMKYVRAPVGNDIKAAPSGKELKKAIHFTLDTIEVDSKGRARDSSQDSVEPTLP